MYTMKYLIILIANLKIPLQMYRRFPYVRSFITQGAVELVEDLSTVFHESLHSNEMEIQTTNFIIHAVRLGNINYQTKLAHS